MPHRPHVLEGDRIIAVRKKILAEKEEIERQPWLNCYRTSRRTSKAIFPRLGWSCQLHSLARIHRCTSSLPHGDNKKGQEEVAKQLGRQR